MKYSFVLLIVFSIVANISGQNFFKDPSFDEPKAPYNNTTDGCENRGVIFDEYSKVYFRVGNGSPDIVVPEKEGCKLYVNSPLIKSQCLGMAFAHTANSTNSIFKEPVFTKLNRPLLANATYEISFDILCNPTFYISNHDKRYYQTSHFNVILRSSASRITDTLTIPVAADSHLNWDRSKLVFVSKSEFDVVQFDFFSKEFFGSDHDVFLYTYLDNFMLINSKEKPTVFKKKPMGKSLFDSKNLSYYFDSDEKKLSRSEHEKLIREIEELSLQEIDSIKILAYTDNVDTEEYNILLSERRAKNILQTLQEKLKDSSIKFVADGKGEDGHLQGEKARRVDINIKYKKGEVAPWYRTSNNEQHSFNYSFIGNTELGKRKDGVPTSKRFRKNHSITLDKIPFDAQKLILGKAKKAKILIINESHTSPNHRVFISNLLPDLKRLGYSKLAVEGLQTDNQPYSLTIKDPVFLRYLLDAQSQSFELISYDNKTKTEPIWKNIKQIDGVEYAEGFENISRDMNIRDYNQFLNLEDDIDRLVDGEKIIIHVGHGHGGKIQIGDWKPLGAYLSEKYGEEAILSIDQVTLNDCISQDSNYYYQQYKPLNSIICSVGGAPYIEKEFNPLTMSFDAVLDLQLVHPDIEAKLSIDTSYIYVNHAELKNASYPLAIMIYEAEANPRIDVAYSAIEVKHKEDLNPSIIPNNGGYKILIKDSKNEILIYDTDGH